MKTKTIVAALLVAGAFLLGLQLAPNASSQEQTTTRATDTQPMPTYDELALDLAYARERIDVLREVIWQKSQKLRKTKTKLRWANHWKRHHKRRAARLYRTLHPQPAWWLAEASCVHSKEGAWDDPNAPYWGGMQMSLAFQRAYGSRWLEALGTADNWPPAVQLLVSWRGYLSPPAGWNPWPNTARACGLPLFI